MSSGAVELQATEAEDPRRPHADSSASGARRAAVVKNLERFGMIICWIVMIIVFGILEPATFLTANNFQLILGSQAVLVVLALGLLFPLTAGDFDLSAAATLTLSAMVIAVLNLTYGVPILVAVGIALCVGALVGLVNGMLVVFLGMDSFIATLGTSTIIAGVIFWISGGRTYSGLPQEFVSAVFLTRPFGIPLAFYYALALCIVVWFVQRYTVVGRRLLYVGRGRSVSKLSGLHVARLRIGALIACGVISAGAGVLYAGTTGGADPSSGMSFLLPTFAAAFLGATCIYVGRFNAWGTLVAVYFLVTGITGLQLMGAQSYVQQLFYGGALIIAVGLTQLRRRKEVRESGAL